MSAGKKFTRQQILVALKLTGGFITHAADLLGCCYDTVSRYLKDDSSLVKELQHIKESRLDLAESTLMLHMEAESLEACKYYLKYMGRSRGYLKASKFEIFADNLSALMAAADRREKRNA